MRQGVIQKINAKSWESKTFYSFTLSGQEGWFNTGTRRPPKEGTSVRFETKTNKSGYLEVDGGIEIATDGAVGPTPAVSKLAETESLSGKTSASTNSGDYWGRKEARDIHNDSMRELGATRNTAIAIIDLGLKYEVFKLPAAAKREEFLWNLIDKYTYKLMGKEGTPTGVAVEAPAQVEAKGGVGADPVVTDEEWH